MIVLLDAGHGIDTPGKRSPDGRFREYKFNRTVADLVLADLQQRGISAQLLVPETNDISLRVRAMRANNVCKRQKDVILVSIHANAAGNGSRWMTGKGWSVYTTRGKTESDKLATVMWDTFAAAFPSRKMRRDLSDGDPDIESDFYIIKKTACPAVLLENFFYDNREECEWLLKASTQGKIARAIADGIETYIRKK